MKWTRDAFSFTNPLHLLMSTECDAKERRRMSSSRNALRLSHNEIRGECARFRVKPPRIGSVSKERRGRFGQ